MRHKIHGILCHPRDSRHFSPVQKNYNSTLFGIGNLFSLAAAAWGDVGVIDICRQLFEKRVQLRMCGG